MAKVGYARVSTVCQNLEMQVQALKKYGCDKIYTEKESGANSQRPEFKLCLDYLREGDELILQHQDRLSRDILHSLEVKKFLKKNQIKLVILDSQIDISTPTGDLTFNLVAAVSQFQHNIIKEKIMLGIANAKANGVKFGRPKILQTDADLKKFAECYKKGLNIKMLMEFFNMKKTSVFYYIKEVQSKGLC